MKDYRFLLEKYVLRQHWPYIPEPKVVKRLKKMRGQLFVDIGCNEKFYAKLLKDNFSRIVTIDPNPKWDADMKIALSNYDGFGTFYIGLDNGSADSLVNNPHIRGKVWKNGETENKCFTVRVRRFDELGLNADLAKVDVELSEFEVINGMRGNPPRSLMVELHDERKEEEMWNLLGSMYRSVTQVDESHFFGEQE